MMPHKRCARELGRQERHLDSVQCAEEDVGGKTNISITLIARSGRRTRSARRALILPPSESDGIKSMMPTPTMKASSQLARSDRNVLGPMQNPFASTWLMFRVC